MKKILLAPDSFKGTLSSEEVCAIMKAAILHILPEARVTALPVADGGEGSVDSFLAALGGKKIAVPCHGPYGEEMMGFYGLLPGNVAVVEMAAAAGLPLVYGRKNPAETTTFGVGELMRAALESGITRLIVGL
ncbi:MAG: glycerate kinase, partial [Ruthenibacterium sp.]